MLEGFRVFRFMGHGEVQGLGALGVGVWGPWGL